MADEVRAAMGKAVFHDAQEQHEDRVLEPTFFGHLAQCACLDRLIWLDMTFRQPHLALFRASEEERTPAVHHYSTTGAIFLDRPAWSFPWHRAHLGT